MIKQYTIPYVSSDNMAWSIPDVTSNNIVDIELVSYNDNMTVTVSIEAEIEVIASLDRWFKDISTIEKQRRALGYPSI